MNGMHTRPSRSVPRGPCDVTVEQSSIQTPSCKYLESVHVEHSDTPPVTIHTAQWSLHPKTFSNVHSVRVWHPREGSRNCPSKQEVMEGEGVGSGVGEGVGSAVVCGAVGDVDTTALVEASVDVVGTGVVVLLVSRTGNASSTTFSYNRANEITPLKY